MGRQINYYAEFETWIKLCEKAIELGFEIVREDKNFGRVTTSSDTDILTEEKGNYYYFHLPEVGELVTKNDGFGKEILDRGYNACGNSIIETGFSRFDDRKKEIFLQRLFIITGYCDENGNFISRPKCIDKK